MLGTFPRKAAISDASSSSESSTANTNNLENTHPRNCQSFLSLIPSRATGNTCDHTYHPPFSVNLPHPLRQPRLCLPQQQRRSPWSMTERSPLRPSSCCLSSITTTAQHPHPQRTSESLAYYWGRMMARRCGYQTASQVRCPSSPSHAFTLLRLQMLIYTRCSTFRGG